MKNLNSTPLALAIVHAFEAPRIVRAFLSREVMFERYVESARESLLDLADAHYNYMTFDENKREFLHVETDFETGMIHSLCNVSLTMFFTQTDDDRYNELNTRIELIDSKNALHLFDINDLSNAILFLLDEIDTLKERSRDVKQYLLDENNEIFEHELYETESETYTDSLKSLIQACESVTDCEI